MNSSLGDPDAAFLRDLSSYVLRWEVKAMTTTLEARVDDFLAQKRIAVAGVSRNDSHHPTGNLIYHRLKTTGT